LVKTERPVVKDSRGALLGFTAVSDSSGRTAVRGREAGKPKVAEDATSTLPEEEGVREILSNVVV
jgi:hypothetical protein